MLDIHEVQVDKHRLDKCFDKPITELPALVAGIILNRFFTWRKSETTS